MSDNQSPSQGGTPDEKESPESPESSEGSEQDETGGTFTTDVSETDDEGTTVRQAEVREDDLTEVDRPKEQDTGQNEQDKA